MIENKNIAFYASIKPPDHHIPSGDRLIAQNIFKALEMSGANIELASRYIAYSKRHGESVLAQNKIDAQEEAKRVLEHYKSLTPGLLPQVWLTYHPYCKAPDWIGPIVSKELGIPYVTIEAAKTGQGGAEDLWKPWRQEAQKGIKQADLHLVFKPSDQKYLSGLLGSSDKLLQFNPFIDAEHIELAQPLELPNHWKKDTPVLITTGMMRKGKKVDNFHILADALTDLGDDFNLIIVGGGPEEMTVQKAFSKIDKNRTYWTGMVEHGDVLRWMRSSDIFIWPGWKEPIGMVYLEAQLQELPVIAYESMGVPLVVEHNTTGLLAPEDDLQTLKNNTLKLLQDAGLRKTMGSKGRRKVLAEHGIKAASGRLVAVLEDVLNHELPNHP